MLDNTKIYTIGFTKTTAEKFFTRLINLKIQKVIDIRLNNTSQLSGFAKAEDLKFFLKSLAKIEYIHEPLLAPTQKILNDYKKNNGEWKIYEEKFLNIMMQRQIEKKFSPDFFENSCLLCSEDKPHYCHRRLVVEYLNEKWKTKAIIKHI
jgi:uncharacterized protein (DUF488 family)